MQVFVRLLSGKTVTLDVEPSDTILQLKRQLDKKLHFPPCMQRLIWKAQSVDDQSDLKILGIKKESTLDMIGRLGGGPPKHEDLAQILGVTSRTDWDPIKPLQISCDLSELRANRAYEYFQGGNWFNPCSCDKDSCYESERRKIRTKRDQFWFDGSFLIVTDDKENSVVHAYLNTFFSEKAVDGKATCNFFPTGFTCWESNTTYKAEIVHSQYQTVLSWTFTTAAATTKPEKQSQSKCSVCLDRPVEFLCYPCGHLCLCLECQDGLSTCPICRKDILESVKVFFS